MSVIFSISVFFMAVLLALRALAWLREAPEDVHLGLRIFFWSFAVLSTLTDPTGPFTRWDLVFAAAAGMGLVNSFWDAQRAEGALTIELDVSTEPSDAPTPEVAAKALNDLATWFEGAEVSNGLLRGGHDIASSLRALSKHLLVVENRP